MWPTSGPQVTFTSGCPQLGGNAVSSQTPSSDLTLCGPTATGSHLEMAQVASTPVKYPPRGGTHTCISQNISSWILSYYHLLLLVCMWGGRVVPWFSLIPLTLCLQVCVLLGNSIFIPKEKCPVLTSLPRSMNYMFCSNTLISQRLLEFCRAESSLSKQPQASECLLFTSCRLWANHHCLLPINSLSSLPARATQKEMKLFRLAN